MIIDYFPLLSPPEVHFCPQDSCNKIVKVASIISLVLGNFFFTPRWALCIHLASLRSLLRASETLPKMIERFPRILALYILIFASILWYTNSCHALNVIVFIHMVLATIHKVTLILTRRKTAILWSWVNVCISKHLKASPAILYYGSCAILVGVGWEVCHIRKISRPGVCNTVEGCI